MLALFFFLNTQQTYIHMVWRVCVPGWLLCNSDSVHVCPAAAHRTIKFSFSSFLNTPLCLSFLSVFIQVLTQMRLLMIKPLDTLFFLLFFLPSFTPLFLHFRFVLLFILLLSWVPLIRNMVLPWWKMAKARRRVPHKPPATLATTQ